MVYSTHDAAHLDQCFGNGRGRAPALSPDALAQLRFVNDASVITYPPEKGRVMWLTPTLCCRCHPAGGLNPLILGAVRRNTHSIFCLYVSSFKVGSDIVAGRLGRLVKSEIRIRQQL
jgi:hypothetical protein